MRFKFWLESFQEAGLRPTDIYDFYYMVVMHQRMSVGSERYLKSRMTEIAGKYIKSLSEVLQRQIEKYISRGRVDSNLEGDYHKNTKSLLDAIRLTYRSDMQRRNDSWIKMAEHLHYLSGHLNDVDKMIFYIDRLNNDIHNTGERVLEKLENGHQILNALDMAHNARTPKSFASMVSRDLRQIANPREM